MKTLIRGCIRRLGRAGLLLLALAPRAAATLPPATAALRGAAATRYLSAVLDSPSGPGVIKDVILRAHLDGAGTEAEAERALARMDRQVFWATSKRVLVETFTVEELNALADFYGSPSGRSLVGKLGDFNASLATALRRDEPVLFGTTGSQAGGGDVFRLGGVAPLTGEAATFGLEAQRGTELAVKQWNSKGGVLGRQIRLAFADDRGDPAEAATVYTRLIERDQVSAIVGTVMSKCSLAGAPICQNARVPMVAPTSTNPRVTQVGDYIFRACFIDPFQGTLGATFSYNRLNARRAACLFDVGNDYTKGLSEYFRAKFKALGGVVTGFEGHATGTTDFKGHLARLLATRPDVLYVSDYYNDVALVAKQARALGFTGPIVGGDGWDSPKLVEVGGKAVENGYFTNHFAADDNRPAVRAFVKQYTAEYGSHPDAIACLAYDAANLVLDAVQRAGRDDGPAIRDALRAADLAAVSGRVRFDADRNPLKSAVIIRIQNGRQAFFAPVEP
jgi:branched-chain amino acid transport system substrate-binding protein